ncbi:hypothetical protein GCM10010306_099120 [Streptomyces umbrinus]|uniref:hypothetical protein n=1 Tax=Streptomyces umbrinus TaxID=67370 RepID=UPI001679D933|nr:hypothetical protein [Streptomyces umbrinus]GHB88301.1 hypothetical protein GCM10010306_099120 [Streptomyces umbrinus]
MNAVAILQETLPFDFEIGISLYSEEARLRACCTNQVCQHQWRPRRPFDPQPFAASA